MVSKKIEQGWLKAEMQIKLEKPMEALEILREIDVDAKQPKTWRLAAEAKTIQARQAKNDKRLFKEAVSHYESALKSNPTDKTARRNLNSLRSEMDGLGIRAGGISIFWDDGDVWLRKQAALAIGRESLDKAVKECAEIELSLIHI